MHLAKRVVAYVWSRLYKHDYQKLLLLLTLVMVPQFIILHRCCINKSVPMTFWGEYCTYARIDYAECRMKKLYISHSDDIHSYTQTQWMHAVCIHQTRYDYYVHVRSMLLEFVSILTSSRFGQMIYICCFKIARQSRNAKSH